MDDIIHLIATTGSGISTLAALIVCWYLADIRSQIATLKDQVQSQGELLARLDERTKDS